MKHFSVSVRKPVSAVADAIRGAAEGDACPKAGKLRNLSDENPVGAAVRRSDLPAKNAPWFFRYYASSFFAGKPRSHRDSRLTDWHYSRG